MTVSTLRDRRTKPIGIRFTQSALQRLMALKNRELPGSYLSIETRLHADGQWEYRLSFKPPAPDSDAIRDRNYFCDYEGLTVAYDRASYDRLQGAIVDFGSIDDSLRGTFKFARTDVDRPCYDGRWLVAAPPNRVAP